MEFWIVACVCSRLSAKSGGLLLETKLKVVAGISPLLTPVGVELRPATISVAGSRIAKKAGSMDCDMQVVDQGRAGGA